MSDNPTPPQTEVPPPPRNRERVAQLLRALASGSGAWGDDLRGALHGFPLRRLVVILALLPVVAYGLSGIYVVNPGEAAVVRRFGAVVQRRVEAGLHYRLPWPFDRVDVVNVANIRRESVGVTAPTGDGHIHDEPMSGFRALTGDTNIIDVEIIVQYQVLDPADFLFNIDYPPHRVIREVVRGSVTNLVASLPVDAILTTDRQRLQEAIRADSQRRLEAYGAGLSIVSISLQKAYPPDEVADAFRDVASAGEDKAKAINEAQGHANSIVPEARGAAQEVLAGANSYAAQVVNAAQGAAQSFESILAEYQTNSRIYGPEVTLYRYYLESMETILPRVRIYVVNDAEGDGLNLRLLEGAPDPAVQTTSTGP